MVVVVFCQIFNTEEYFDDLSKLTKCQNKFNTCYFSVPKDFDFDFDFDFDLVPK